MRFIVLLKLNASGGAGGGDPALLESMAAYNVRLRKAGVLNGGELLRPRSEGANVKFTAQGPAVDRGPFTEADGLLRGFWIFNCGSLEDAIAWASQAPLVAGAELEVHPLVALGADGRERVPASRS
jgi:hypothetical protein